MGYKPNSMDKILEKLDDEIQSYCDKQGKKPDGSSKTVAELPSKRRIKIQFVQATAEMLKADLEAAERLMPQDTDAEKTIFAAAKKVRDSEAARVLSGHIKIAMDMIYAEDYKGSWTTGVTGSDLWTGFQKCLSITAKNQLDPGSAASLISMAMKNFTQHSYVDGDARNKLKAADTTYYGGIKGFKFIYYWDSGVEFERQYKAEMASQKTQEQQAEIAAEALRAQEEARKTAPPSSWGFSGLSLWGASAKSKAPIAKACSDDLEEIEDDEDALEELDGEIRRSSSPTQ